MADLTITPANVTAGSGASKRNDQTAGETLTAGQAVYQKSADKKWYKAQADGSGGTAAEEASFGGVALNGASAGQPVVIQQSGEINIGATVAVGTVYVVSATSGGIAPIADLVSTNYVTIIGVGKSTTVLAIQPIVSGVQKA